MREENNNKYTNLHQSIVRVIFRGDLIEVLGDDCGVSDRVPHVLVDVGVERRDIDVSDFFTVNTFVEHLSTVGPTTCKYIVNFNQ